VERGGDHQHAGPERGGALDEHVGDGAGADPAWAPAEAALAAWRWRARQSQLAHYAASRWYRALGYAVGAPAVVLSTAVGAVALATLGGDVGGATRAAIGAASMAAGVLSAVQTHFQFGRLAERHMAVGVKYGAARRRIEGLLACPPAARPAPPEALDVVRIELDVAAGDGDTVPSFLWERTAREMAARERCVAGPWPRPG
jgi:hypothetical protein